MRLTLVIAVTSLLMSLGATVLAQEELPRCEAGDPYPVAPDPPEGQRILLHLTDQDNEIFELAITTPDVAEIVNLTHDFGAEVRGGTWSPDGSWIAFSSDEGGSGNNIWIMDSQGQNRRQLTVNWGLWPTWSPDGTTIAFVGWDGDIRFVDVRGCDERHVLAVGGPIKHLVWSPDGSAIAFTRWPSDGDDFDQPQIFSLSIPEFEMSQLTDDPGGAIEPTWSPDGSLIAFLAYQREGAAIWAMRPNGEGEYPLYSLPTVDSHPSWSPDGNQVAVNRINWEEGDEGALVSTVDLRDGTLVDLIVSPFGEQRFENPVWSPGTPLAAVVPVPPLDEGSPIEDEGSPIEDEGSPIEDVTTETTVVAGSGEEQVPTGGLPIVVWILSGVLALSAAFFAGAVIEKRKNPPPPALPPPQLE